MTPPSQIDGLADETAHLLAARTDLVLNAVDQGIYCLDTKGCTTFANEAAVRMLGYTLREMLGRSQHELIHHHYADGTPFPVDACPIWSSVRDGVHQRVGGDVFWRKDGTPLPVDYTSTPIRDGRTIVAVVVTFRDVTVELEARRHAERLAAERAAREEAERGERALRESEARFRLALAAGRMGTWEWDIAGQRVLWSPEEETMYGMEPGSFTGTLDEYRERIHPDDREESLALVRRNLEQHADTHHVLHRVLWPDGTVRWLESFGRFLYDDDATPLRLSGVSTDVTERVEAERRLRERDERFRAVIAATGQIVWTNSAEGKMTGEQPGWARYTGQSQEEYAGFGWANAVHPDDAGPTVEAWNKAVAERSTFVFEHRVRGRDGQYRFFSIRAIPLLDERGEIREWVGSHMDITDQRATRDALGRALAEAQHARAELQRVFEQAPAAIATLEGEDLVFRTANWRFKNLVGNRELMGKPVRVALPDLEGQPFFGLLDEVYRTGKAYEGKQMQALVDRTGTGILEPGVFDFVYQPLTTPDGAVTGIMIHAIEVEGRHAT